MSGTFDLHSILLTLISSGAAVKILMMMARSMPPPPASCGFWCRWFYDFVQIAMENSDKVGKVQDPTKPIGVETATVTLGKVVKEAEKIEVAA